MQSFRFQHGLLLGGGTTELRFKYLRYPERQTAFLVTLALGCQRHLFAQAARKLTPEGSRFIEIEVQQIPEKPIAHVRSLLLLTSFAPHSLAPDTTAASAAPRR